MTEEEKTATLPSDVTDFLGMERKRTGGYDTLVRQPSFAGGTDDFNDQTKKERRARFKASADMLFSTDVSKLDDTGAAALYQSVTEGMFGLPDEDGSVAFGKRASKDPRANIDMLRKFVKGDYALIEDPEYTKWRQMDEEAKFRYALENETTGNKLRSYMKGERGAGFLENLSAGVGMSIVGLPAGAVAFQPQHIREQNQKIAMESARRSNYDTLTDEEKAEYRADVVADYDEKLSRRQTLATFLQFAHGLSDRAGYLLAKAFNDGTPDAANIEGLPEDERDRVYAAFSLMRGDQKKGRILGIQTDFTDDTVVNRLQLGFYGFQQSVVGLVTDTADLARDAAMWAYAKTAMDEAERKAFFKGWDANVRAEQAMNQSLPEADTFGGEAFQGLAENLHWFIPYSMIGKGGKMAKGARAAVARAGLQKEVAEGGLTLAKAAAEASRARWLADVEGAVKAGKGAKKISEFSSAIAMRRQLAAVEQYTAALREIPNVVKAAKWKDAAGAGMWAAGEASAFSAFASEYIANADAAGISREESVLTAAAIGLINAKIEQLYVPGLESSLTPAQIKSLTFAAMAQSIKTDGAAGFRKWLANRVSKGVTEGMKVTLTEGAVEEPLQQMAIEHGKAFDKLCGELRANGQSTLANEAKALWDSFARTLPQDYATFIDTAADMVPSSLGFGVTTIGNMTRRQHIHNAMTRHANRRAGSTSTMMTAQTMQELQGATDYDAGLVDVIQQAVNVRAAVEKHWQGKDDGGEAKNPHRFEEAITAARRAWRDPQTGDAVQEIADAAGVDVKTAEVLAQYLQTEAEAAAFSPQARAWTSLNMSLADIDEATIKTVLPGYVEGSFASDPENGIYSGRVRMDDGTEKTIAYRVGDLSAELVAEAQNMAEADSSFGKSFDARHAELGDGVTWASLSDAQRYAETVRSQASVNGFSTGKSGVFELTDSKGEKVRVNADDIIYLANGRIGDIGYGPAATQGTVRHETFHSLWRFVRGTLADADVQQLAKTLGIDVTKDGWEVTLDERMAHEMERYASGRYVSHAVSSRFDKMLDSWAGKIINFFGQFGPSDEVTDPKTGKPYQLKGLYDSILRGELGSGALGVELRKVPQQTAERTATPASSMPVEVTDADRAAQEAEAQAEADESARTEENLVQPQSPKTHGQNATVDESSATASKVVHTAENPADAATPNQVYYRVGLPNSPVKLVGRLDVRDVDNGIITSTDADYHDRGNQNRDDKSEESRALVEKIGANPDPLQIGTVQPIASNGIIWMLPNGDVIIGNHRVNGVRLGYAKGTTAELEKFVREDAAKRDIEIGADVKKPLMVFVLERIESPDGKADVHEVVRLANESQNRGFNIREQAGNDAKILTDNSLLPRMAFRADGRIDETKSGDAIGKFRQESGAQGLIAEDGSITEDGQTRIQNATLAVLLGGEGSSRQSQGGGGNNALLNKIMTNAGRLDMQSELRALMKMTPELMALAETKPAYDLRGPLAEALQLFTEWRDRDETSRVEKGKTRHDWRETTKDGTRKRGLSWEAYLSQGDMFRTPSDEAKILGDLFAKAESLRSFDREDVESSAGKKRVIDLISDYLADYIANARAVNTETDDMFGETPASRADVLAAQRATGGEIGGETSARFSIAHQRVSPEEDAAYADAVKRGDMKTVRRMEREVYERMGYSDDSSYQGTSAFNGAAPSRNAYFETKAERIEAAKNGEMEDTTTLGDYRDGIDVNNLQFIVFDPRSERYADPMRQEAIRNIRGVLDSGAKTITMYRSVPADVKETQFRNGDWITPSRAYAEENAKIHGWGDKFRIIEQEVSVEDVWWDGNDIAEWGFDDGRGSVYKNTAANRKLLGPTYDDAGNLIPLSKRFNDWKNDIRYSIGGQGGAANLGLKSAADAEQMEKDGASREDIWRTTGWWRGKDGAWRIEIPPLKMKSAKDIETVLREGGNEAKLGMIVDAPELFKAYPDMKNVKVEFDPKGLGSADAQYNRRRDVITIFNAGLESIADLPPVMVDRYNHYYQMANSETYLRGIIEQMDGFHIEHGTFEEEREKAKQRVAEYERGVAKRNALMMESLASRDDAFSVFSRLNHEVQHAIQEREHFAAGSSPVVGIYDPSNTPSERAIDEYRRAAGEVEARNVQTRLAMTPEERAEVPPWETEDTPTDRQIIRYSIAQTETPRFKAWFGDWENDPANASKVVDRAGRPRVVYHGTPNGKFWTFDKNRIGETWNADETGFFFTSDRHIAEDYTKPYFRENSADPNLFAVYLSIKNPLVIDRNWWQRNYGRSDIYNHDAIEIWDNEQGTILDEMRNGGHDGVIIDPNPMGGAAKMYMVPEPTQIKSATDNTGAFDPRNPDIRYSIAAPLVAAMQEREAMQSIPVEGKVQPWPENFPKVMLQTTLASIKQKWPELHAAAKAGSDGAALELVRNILGGERVGNKANPKWEKLRVLADAHPRAIVSYVHAEEATGRNKIPAAYAAMIEKITGLHAETRIVQAVRAHHTGANAVERMTRRAAFDGPVRRGAEYILVDDHVTQGGTLNELRKYIQSRGGKVVAVTTLTASQFSDTLPISRDAVLGLYTKFGNNLDEELQKAGIASGVAELTQSQARELLKLRADTLRDRLAQARLNRHNELDAQAVRLADGAVGERWSTEAPRSGLVYPQLRSMSDDELLAAAVATRMALGASDKFSDRAVTINTVQKMLRRLHPDWDRSQIGRRSTAVMGDARKLGKKIREDIDRGVSESLVLRHLPASAREQFGVEMRQEARKGQRLGVFAQRVKGEIDERQARIVEDAVRVQTGIDADNIENAYGINLSETIMHLAENPLAEKPPQTAGGAAEAGEDGAASAEDGEGEATEAAAEIDAKVRAAVADIINSARIGAEADERNRKNRRAAAGRDAEREAEMAAEDADGSVPGDSFAGEDDALAAAVAKEGLNLENPRHLARFVAELARRQWIKEHGLALNADVWRDLVAVQFLRKTAQSVYAKLVRDLVYSRSRETAMQRIAKLDAVPTVAGLLSEMEFVGALINAQRIRDTQKALCEKLDLFLRQKFGAQGRFKPDKEEGKRTVSAEAELRARYMRHAMWLTPGAAAEEARGLQETLDALSVDFKDAGRDRDQSREFVETIRKLNVLREFGALRYKPVGEIEAATKWWEDFARGESDEILREASDRDIRTKKAAHLLAVAFADPKRTTIREGGKADALNRFVTGHMGFISLLQDCMRHASDADAAAVKDIIDYISREIQKSGDRSEAEKRRHNDAFHSAVEGIYSKSFNDVMKDMMAPDERFTKYMGVVGGKRVTPTKGRALQLLVSLLQEGRKVQVEDEENPGQTKTVWEGGYHDNIVKHHREGQAAEIMRLLDPADMNMLKWLGQWYENNRADLSGVCHSLFGIGVYAELPNYFPVKMQLETQGLEKGNGVGWTIFPKALTPRVRNERDFDTSADIFSMWASRMEEAAQWKHHAQLGLEMRGIFGRAELREAVRANHGASVDDLMQGFITDILAGHGAYDRSTAGVQYFSDQIRGWTALCALGGNIGVMLKQTTSIPAFGFEIGLVNTAKYMVNAFTPEGMAAMGKIWDSEQRRTRWNLGSSEAVRNALSQQNAGMLKRMFQASMITTKVGDVVPALVVGQGIYRDCLDRGMSEEDAMAETWSIIERTQQSGRMENQTSIQRRNKLGRIMFQFLSTQQQYLQYELRAIREVIARPDSVKRWGGLGRAILLNHFILSSAYYWMGQLYKYALGQEPPEDELKDWIVTCLLGPYGSLFVAGFCCKYTLERAIKGYSIKGGSSMLPMESWLKNQVNDGAKLLEAIFDSDGDTWDNMLEAAGRWMSDSNSTVRDLRKIYRYRIKGERQK